MKYPIIIQGGMGVGVSNWTLAKAVSKMGHLGVISGTAIDNVITRRLQMGDPGGHLKRAFDNFPVPEIARHIYDKYFIPGGKAISDAFKRIPMYSLKPNKSVFELTVLSNFTEVFLAKEGHDGVVGINLLEKVQMPNLASLYGAMLAGVDYVLMGAGIPREIPGILDKFVHHEEATLKITVETETGDDHHRMVFDPKSVVGNLYDSLKRPNFLAIISSAVLAISLARKSTGEVNGFIIEGPTAGGHNTPPRGGVRLNDNGEPIYGEKDEVDLEKIKELGLPFWMAGSYGDSAKVMQALEAGAAGVQVGTPFAFCQESGLTQELKHQVLSKVLDDEISVKTDAYASPTGFPFKVVQLEGTLSSHTEYQERPRVCDLGYLRTVCQTPDGQITYRCPSEPVKDYVRKHGKEESTVGRKCLCNGLFANIGLPQKQMSGYSEKPLLTSGSELSLLKKFISRDNLNYSAADVIHALCPQMELVEA
ncbi:MAG: nitronate monooxygenase [bacterium]|jgi:nitronate monooxygenase